jgi:DNA-binding response OmpR family regulator
LSVVVVVVFPADQRGADITALELNRAQKMVAINSMEFTLTDNALETLSVLCEARLDDEIISGIDLEAAISGKPPDTCEEAAGATRIKRLRDHLGNQLLSQLLIRHVSREGYMLTISPDVIRLR